MSKSSYHHGNLRRVVLDNAVKLIAEAGVDEITLRELSRRAEVSHGAPAHHFGDKAGLFTAIATEGYQLLAAALEGDDDRPTLKEQGVRYVEFAEEHPAHFDVMYRPDLLHADDPDLIAARQRAGEALRRGVEEVGQPPEHDDLDSAALAAWALAHGFAALRRSGSLDQLPEGRTSSDAFRAAASHLFATPP